MIEDLVPKGKALPRNKFTGFDLNSIYSLSDRSRVDDSNHLFVSEQGQAPWSRLSRHQHASVSCSIVY